MKLIKTETQYRLHNDDGVVIATSEGKLSLKNCEAIANGYDLAELLKKEITDGKLHPNDGAKKEGIARGIELALEIFGDKKFSGEDLRTAYNVGYSDGQDGASFWNKFIQSLQQTEWEVEIVMKFRPINHASGLKFTGHKLMDISISENYQPKLDADGCLILKLK